MAFRLSHLISPLLLCFASVLPMVAVANTVLDSDIDYSRTESTALGHALYTRVRDDAMKSIGILLNADINDEFGKDKALGLILLGDQLSEQGLKKQALRLYKEAFDEGGKKKVVDAARLHYAKIRHELEQYEVARKALEEVDKGSLSKTQRMEYDVILAHALLRAGDVDDAIDEIPSTRHASLWGLYQLYNLGSELLGMHNNKHGASVLHKVSKVDDEGNPELLALKDQSNLVLGFSLLKISQSNKARKYFQQVRLNGSMSNMALLGMGWSYALEENYEKSLVYWLELQARPLGGTYSYESSLAIPYAFGRANAYQQSISFYKAALNRFETDIEAMEVAKPAIESAIFLELLAKSPEDEQAWVDGWDPTSPESRFLPLFMDNTEFQRHLQEFRALLGLKLYIIDMIADIRELERMGGGTLHQLRKKHQLLLTSTNKAIEVKHPILKRLAVSILESYQSQLNNYLQQTRLGMAQVIEKATLEFEFD